MADIEIIGDIEALCAQITSGEAAEGYARMNAALLQHLREWENATSRLSFPLHGTPVTGDALPPEMPELEPEPEPSEPFRDRLRALLQRHTDHDAQED